MIYFTADLHFQHRNIVTYTNRPWANIDAMNEGLVERWNETVTKSDHTYILGDFCLGRWQDAVMFANRLNGTKTLVYGNHDKALINKPVFKSCFVEVVPYLQVSLLEGEPSATLFHYPMITWDRARYGSWHLHGHSHGSLSKTFTGKRLDVGVDCHDYRPISLTRVAELMATKRFTPVDHHGE